MTKSKNSVSLKLRGVPKVLLPVSRAGTKPGNCYTVVENGARDLAERPFDYRNPFPLFARDKLVAKQSCGKNGVPLEWPFIADNQDCFDYYCNDHTSIGLPGGPHCALIDLHGTLRCFSGAWAFGLGERAEPPRVRVRTLRDGCVPIVEAGCEEQEMKVRFKWFTTTVPGLSNVEYPLAGNESFAWVGGDCPSGPNHVHRVECFVTNNGSRCLTAKLHLGYAQGCALCSGAFYSKPRYSPAWKKLCLNPLSGDSKAVLASHAADQVCLGVLEFPGWRIRPGNVRIRHWPAPLTFAPKRHASYGFVLEIKLAPGESGRIGVWVPEFPASLADADVLAGVESQKLEQQTLKLWRKRHFGRTELIVPEDKVAQAYKQALNHLEMMSVSVGAGEYPTPGPNGGHHVFYDRDAIDMIHAFDVAGDFARAERMIDHYWLRGVGQESASMVLWLIGKHYDMTRNKAWAEKIFPMVVRCMTCLIRLWTDRQSENDGLFPASSLHDNELAHGHYVSYHIYAVAGLHAGARIAELLGKAPPALEWTAFAKKFQNIVVKRLEELGRSAGGVITPTFEGLNARPVTVDINWENPPRKVTFAGPFGKTGGCDWHNLAVVFPTGVLAPHHPLVTSSLERWRHMYVEGAFPYAQEADYSKVHNYNGMNISGAWLRRGDWAETVRDLYGVLLHTSSSHASAEVVNTAMRLDYNCTPHNWFSGKLVRFIRDLLVYEETGGYLHLLGGLSPAWMQPGMVVGIKKAPTEYGTFSYTAVMRKDGMRLDIKWKAPACARGLVLHLPPFLRSVRTVADGVNIRAVSGAWKLPVCTRKVDVTWKNTQFPDISFCRVVKAYLADYACRVGKMPGTGVVGQK